MAIYEFTVDQRMVCAYQVEAATLEEAWCGGEGECLEQFPAEILANWQAAVEGEPGWIEYKTRKARGT